MNIKPSFSHKQSGSLSTLIVAILTALVVVGGVVYFVKGGDNANNHQSSTNSQASSTQSSSPQDKQVQETPRTNPPKPKIAVDPDIFCEQISEVGQIFGEELTGATIRANVSHGPQVGCSWSGPYVLVYFGDNSYNRRNTGFGSENLVAYEGTDQESAKREKYAVHSGFEVEVKSDSGRAFRISQSTGRQTDLTSEEYKKIANIVNGVLGEHY